MELSEVIEKCRVDDVFLCEGPRPPQKGTLALIGHHLIFSSTPKAEPTSTQTPTTTSSSNSISSKASRKNHIDNQELWLLHRAVDRVLVEPISRDPNNTNQGAFLRLKCKNFMHLCFELIDLNDCRAVARSIETLSNLNGIEHDYPFYYRCPFTVLDDGWEAHILEEKFSKLQLLVGDKFRISSANKDFELCSTYPEKVIVPKGIGDDYLRISATFRSGGRFPVLSYYHQRTKSTIYRSAQPLIGPTNRRCKEDEVILNSMLSKFSKGLIFDTRPKLLAQTSRGKGGGCESQMFYSQWKYVNGNVPRIGDLRESLTRLIEACIENSHNFLTRLANSGWLQYIADTLTGAATVAQVIHCMDEGTAGELPVLVHGSEGMDSTLLVTSLAQLLLEPDARTIRGFQSLIEHEWIMAGHPFTLRCAHSAFATGAHTGPYESPVFLCFLDCVWQIMRQYPSCLEFNEQFLIFLFEHAYASEFGSFLGNNEEERRNFGVKMRTVSLWSYVNHPQVLPAFLNCIYEPYDQPLWPSVSPQSILLWERIFFRWQRDWMQFDQVQQMLNEWKREEKRLISKLIAMQQQQKHQHSENSRSISACSTVTSTEMLAAATQMTTSSIASSSQFHHGQQSNSPPPPPFTLEAVVKMDRLNIRTVSGDEDAEGSKKMMEEDEFEFIENKNGFASRIGKRIWTAPENNTATAMLNGAKQTARQIFQKIGPSFM